MRKILKYILGIFFIFCIITVLLLIMVSRYVYQEPAQLVYTRAIQAEVTWQSAKYPSLGFIFNVIRSFYVPDPGKNFKIAAPGNITGKILTTPPLHVGPSPLHFTPPAQTANSINVTNKPELINAIAGAKAGDVIVIAAGEYNLTGYNIPLAENGNKDHPITLRADRLGTVTLKFDLLEGFHITGAYWTIENLIIEGVCKDDSNCEHAFHIAGNGHNARINNNIVKNFNAHVKINAVSDKSPDSGIIENNLFYNDAPRKTSNPVTLIDGVSVSHWRVANNIVADFAKLYDDNTSYAAFFKGGGEDNIFEKNLVMCEWRHKGGMRIGLSFGGGGTAAEYCPDKNCGTENSRGIIRNNIIMNCPRDVGIYLNKSADTLIHNNIIYNTHGIDVRFKTTTAEIFNNVIDGRIRSRNGGFYKAQNNIMSYLSAIKLDSIVQDIYQNPALGNFEPRHRDELIKQGVSARNLGDDICGQKHSDRQSDIGPVNLQKDETCPMNMDFIHKYIQ
jgi:hypothetical protein